MTEIENRLMECFTAAFPDIPVDEIRSLQAKDSDLWDSLATVTLAGLVEEEFDMDIGAEQAPHFVSFESLVAFLSQS